MRESRRLERKIKKLESKAGLGGSTELPQDLRTVYIFDQKEDQPAVDISYSFVESHQFLDPIAYSDPR